MHPQGLADLAQEVEWPQKHCVGVYLNSISANLSICVCPAQALTPMCFRIAAAVAAALDMLCCVACGTMLPWLAGFQGLPPEGGVTSSPPLHILRVHPTKHWFGRNV
jgi:hypothetical protein